MLYMRVEMAWKRKRRSLMPGQFRQAHQMFFTWGNQILKTD